MRRKCKNVEFPKINYQKWLSRYNWDNIGTSQGMITTLLKKDLIDNDVSAQNVTEKITFYIKKFILERNHYDLFMVFKLIQAWGGKSAGSHTLKIISKWELNDNYYNFYLDFVNHILKGNYADGFNSLFDNKNNTQIKGFGFSFIPKHICFWSGEGDRSLGQPILDNIIAKILYFEDESKNVDYSQFLVDMKDFSQIENLKVAELEMALFTFASHFWETKKTGTSILRTGIVENQIDKYDLLAIQKIINRS
jgi:hypothetical protein